MPPMALTGVVTKVGFMQKTATVTVSRYMVHRKTHKVGSPILAIPSLRASLTPFSFQRIERSKKYLTHDADNCTDIFPPRNQDLLIRRRG